MPVKLFSKIALARLDKHNHVAYIYAVDREHGKQKGKTMESALQEYIRRAKRGIANSLARAARCDEDGDAANAAWHRKRAAMLTEKLAEAEAVAREAK